MIDKRLFIACLPIVFGCEKEYAVNKPSINQISGTYATSDSRAQGAQLVLNSDGTCVLRSWPRASGTGKWFITKNEVTKYWDVDIILAGNGNGEFWMTGQRIVGNRPPYSIEFYLVDPDNGPIVFALSR